MAPWLPGLVGALPCVIFLCATLREVASDSVARPSSFVRQGRSLTFPYGFGESYLEFTFGVGLPMNLPSPYQVSMSLEMRADYKYPVNASDFTNPTKRREDEEKEKEEMEKAEKEKKEKSKENASVKKADDQHHSADAPQSRANGGDSHIGEKQLNNTNTRNSTKCPDGMVQNIEQFKFITNENGSNITTANADEVTKGGCYGKDEDNTKPFESGEKESKLGLVKKNIYLEKSLFSEFKGIANNFTNRAEYVGSNGEDMTNKNKTANENIDHENINREGADERKGGARFIRKRDTGGRSTRWRIYHVLEMAANNLGMDGRACLLRSICDAAATPLHHRSNELVGELLHVLFTPSTTDDDRGRHLDNEYRAAEHLGSDVGNSCELLYPECDVSFLDLITTFDLF